MRKEPSNGHKKIVDSNLESFLVELTKLSIKYKIGISDTPVLFCMEEEDLQTVGGEHRFKYFADEDSRLCY